MNKSHIIKTTSIALLILSFLVPLVSIGATQACWWRQPLRARMDLDLGNMRPVGPGEPGYIPGLPPKDQVAALTWTGFISGGINGYMRFFLMNYIVEGENGEWGHFFEVWQIFDEEGGELLMEGYDEGYTHQPTGKYAMIGPVTYTSSEFARWQGHVVFRHGTISPPPAEWETNPAIPVAPGRFCIF